MITFFGASVTLQKSGYAKVLKSMFEEEVAIFGYGGMHLNNAGICFIGEVLATKPSFCFVDFFSTGYVKENEKTKEYLDTIVYKFSKSHCKLIFLFFPRKYDNKNWYLFCKNYLDEKKLFYIDVDSKVKYEKHKLLKDDVHTNNKGSKVYAEIIYKEFNKIKSSIEVPDKPVKTKYIDIKHLKVEKMFNDKIIFEGYAEIIGMLNTIGPYSGMIEIETTDKKKRVLFWDRWCYYTREHFNCKFECKNYATISILSEKFDTSECKYNVNFFSKRKKIILHDIFYIGDTIKISNHKDGARICHVELFFLNVIGRVTQLFKKYKNKFFKDEL